MLETIFARKTRAYVAGLLTLGLLAAVAALVSPTASATEYSVGIQNVQFNPNTLTINVGDTVTWTNNETDGTVHSSTSDDAVWNSPDMAPGAQFSFTFTTAGTFNYHCRFHPAATGTITVNGGGNPPPTTTPPPPPPPTTTTTDTPPPTTTTTDTPPPTTTTTDTPPPTTTTTETTSPTTTTTAPPPPPTSPAPPPSCTVPLPGSIVLPTGIPILPSTIPLPLPSCVVPPPTCLPLTGLPLLNGLPLPACLPLPALPKPIG